MIAEEHEERRGRRLIAAAVDAVELDLRGLTVLTEASSGPYRFNPLLAACAGARRVYALARDSRHHRADDVEAATRAAARRLGVAERVDVVRDKRPEHLAEADVVTNSAPLRPLRAQEIARMKPTAVVALGWESWEYRPADVDLAACRRHGVLVLGTHECRPPCDLVPYCGLLAVRLLFDLGLEVHRTSVLLLGRQALGREMERFLRAAGGEVETFSAPGDGGRPYAELAAHIRRAGDRYDALLVAEHVERGLLLGPGGRLEPEALAAANPAVRVGVVAGAVDAGAARAAGLVVVPEAIRPPGYMSSDVSLLGSRPILELFAATLRTGEAAARARLRGLSLADAAADAIRSSPAMDLEGEDAWCRAA